VATDVAGSDALPEPTFVPVLGRIAAGGPILAEEREDVSRCHASSWVKGSLFLLKVVGDSMTTRQSVTATGWSWRQQNVATRRHRGGMIEGEATVKTFKRTRGQVWLMPHNRRSIRSPATTPRCSARSSR